MSLKFTEKLCVMTMKNDAEFEEKLTRRFKIDKRNLTNFELTTQKSQKFAKYTMFEIKSTEELDLMTLKIDVKFEGKLTRAFQNDMKNLANFHRLKNSDFILESKIGELNQNKDSKQLDRPDA